MAFYPMISVYYLWFDLQSDKDVYVFVHKNEQKCQKIKQNVVFE